MHTARKIGTRFRAHVLEKITVIVEKLLLQPPRLTPDYRYGLAVHKPPALGLLIYGNEVWSWHFN